MNSASKSRGLAFAIVGFSLWGTPFCEATIQRQKDCAAQILKTVEELRLNLAAEADFGVPSSTTRGLLQAIRLAAAELEELLAAQPAPSEATGAPFDELALAFTPRDIPVPEWVAALVREVRSEGVDLGLTKSEREQILLEITEAGDSARNVVVALSQFEKLRENLAKRAVASLKEVARNASVFEEEVDILFVGAGLHEQNSVNFLRQVAPRLRTLTIEKAQEPLSTFVRGGKVLTMNSPSRPADRRALRQVPNRLSGDGRTGGDLNFLPGALLQPSDFVSAKFPFLREFGQAGQINRALASSEEGEVPEGRFPILFEESVVRMTPIPDTNPPMIRVELLSGRSVRARNVVITGIGTPRRVAPPSERVMRWEQFLEMATRDPKGTFQTFNGKRIGVIGARDSGIAAVRFVTGNRPEAFGGRRAEGEGAAQVLWFGQEAKTCDAFRESNRTINADLGALFRNGKVVAKPKVKNLFDSGSQVEIRTVEQTVLQLDYVIDATGFTSQLPNLLRGIDGGTILENLMIDESGLGLSAIAQQVRRKSDSLLLPIFVAGPEAQGIVSSQETGNLSDNQVANFVWNWRLWRLMQRLTKVKLNSPTSPLLVAPTKTQAEVDMLIVPGVLTGLKPTSFSPEEIGRELVRSGVFPKDEEQEAGFSLSLDTRLGASILRLKARGLQPRGISVIESLLSPPVAVPNLLNYVLLARDRGFDSVEFLWNRSARRWVNASRPPTSEGAGVFPAVFEERLQIGFMAETPSGRSGPTAQNVAVLEDFLSKPFLEAEGERFLVISKELGPSGKVTLLLRGGGFDSEQAFLRVKAALVQSALGKVLASYLRDPEDRLLISGSSERLRVLKIPDELI